MPAEARLLFIGLWTLADREGRLQDRPIRIAAQLFPYDSWPVDTLLSNLTEAGLIRRYEVEGHKCIQIINFLKHQHIHPNESTYGLPASLKQITELTGNSRDLPGNKGDACIMDVGLMDLSALPPTPLSGPVEKTGARDSRSRFSLKECVKYAKSQKNIKSPEAFGKAIWRSGDQDDEIAAYQAGHSGTPVKKPPDKPPDPAELKRLADDLDAMKHHEDAKALRASVKLE